MWVFASSWKCPFISESTHILLWVSCQLISLSPLISTKCSNYTRISWATKTQKMASYLPPPRLTLALKLDRLPQTTGRRERRKWAMGDFWAAQRQNSDKAAPSFFNWFVSPERSPKSGRFKLASLLPVTCMWVCTHRPRVQFLHARKAAPRRGSQRKLPRDLRCPRLLPWRVVPQWTVLSQ